MTNKTYLFIAAVCASIGSIANKFATDIPEETPAAELTAGGEPENTDKPKRGRPAKTAAPTEPETPATPEPGKGEKAAAGAKEYSDEELREAAAKLIEDGQGEAVKKLIPKHGGTGKMATIPAANRAAFIRDLEAMDM